MDAASFNGLFDEIVSPPMLALGFEQQGRRLTFQDASVQMALARTEHRSQPPAELTLLYRHRFLRDRTEVVPAKVPREPNDFPIKLALSNVPAVLAGTWAYAPTMARPPADRIDYPNLSEEAVRARLHAVATVVVQAVPQLPALWTPALLHGWLRARGDKRWWVEQLWLDDYERHLDVT